MVRRAMEGSRRIGMAQVRRGARDAPHSFALRQAPPGPPFLFQRP